MLAPPRTPVQAEPAPAPVWPSRDSPRRSRGARARRVALVAALVCLVPVVVSYVSAMMQRSDSSLGIRTVEWMRDNGARGLVNTVENWYYSLTAPAEGGPALHSLPAQAGVFGGTGTATAPPVTVRPTSSGPTSFCPTRSTSRTTPPPPLPRKL